MTDLLPDRPRSFIATRLAAMMFLELFVWGAWYVTLNPFMTAMHMESGIGNAYTVAPIAAIVAPFFLGLVADRFFATERVLGILHLLGGVALLAAPAVAMHTPILSVSDHGHTVEFRSAWPFVSVLLLHTLCYMPTLGLVNTLAFHNLTNRETQFPLVRVLGTVGWIVAGLTVGWAIEHSAPAAQQAASPVFFYVAGGAGLVMGLYSFTLPHTPPPAASKKSSVRDVLGLDALALMRNRSFLVFILGSLLISIPLAAYFAFAAQYVHETGVPVGEVPKVMDWGQFSEIFFMVLMPLCFRWLGVKRMLALGMAAWVTRYALFSGAWAGQDEDHVRWMILLGILLHGVCYDFFFVTGFIYVDRRIGPEIRGQAQGLLVVVTQGLGLGIGAQLFQRLVKDPYTIGIFTDWRMVWAIPSAFAMLVLLLFLVFFRDDSRAPIAAGEGAAGAGPDDPARPPSA